MTERLPYAVLTGGGLLGRRYATKARALAALKRRREVNSTVAWCNDAGTPKVWLAHWTDTGLQMTYPTTNEGKSK